MRYILILLMLTGCVASNPELTIINQQELIGTWELSSLFIKDKMIDPEEKFIMTFKEDNTLDVLHEGQPTKFTYKYIVDEDDLTVLAFMNGTHRITITANFKLNNGWGYFTEMRAKDAYAGEINYKKLWPTFNMQKVRLAFKKTS